MIQFNLLPDVKIKYIKARRQKRLVALGSTVLMIAALSVFVFLFVYVRVVQQNYSNDLSADIKTNSNRLQSVKDLDKILTVQNQLRSVDGLHDAKPVTTRLFGYLTQVTPTTATIKNLEVDFETKKMTITGSADNLNSVNKFVDTLKFTSYVNVVDGKPQKDSVAKAFSDVVMSSFARSEETTYSITTNFDAAIFDSKNDVSLVVPNIITTRVQDAAAGELFQAEGGR